MTVAHMAGPVAVSTPVHRLAPECKLAAFVAFVLAVALMPYGATWPYAIDATLLSTLALWTRTPAALVGKRLLIEAPFVAIVCALPFLGGGRQVGVLGLSLSHTGLWLAWGIAAKATLAVIASAVLGSTTTGPELLAGAERLRVPRMLTAIAGFALRYLQVVLDELRRLQLARVARGDNPRWIWQARTVTRTAGTLMVRGFARGERVHAAMLARGFDGRMPDVGMSPAAPLTTWLLALLPAALALLTTVAATV